MLKLIEKQVGSAWTSHSLMTTSSFPGQTFVLTLGDALSRRMLSVSRGACSFNSYTYNGQTNTKHSYIKN